MTKKAGYPLTALERVRRDAAEQRGVELAEQLRAREQAEAVQRRAEAERRAEQQSLRDVAEGEAARALSGEARAVDLMREATFRDASERRTRELADRERSAAQDTAAERAREAEARAALGRADGEVRAVERHHGDWSRAQAAAADSDAEEQAQDRWSAQRVNRAREGRG